MKCMIHNCNRYGILYGSFAGVEMIYCPLHEDIYYKLCKAKIDAKISVERTQATIKRLKERIKEPGYVKRKYNKLWTEEKWIKTNW